MNPTYSNSDPSHITPRIGDVSEIVTDAKPKIDEIIRGTAATSYLKELTLYYPSDRIAPGLQSAWLEDKAVFYVSIHRFPAGNIASRTVIAKATAETLATAEAMCMEIWRNIARQVESARKS